MDPTLANLLRETQAPHFYVRVAAPAWRGVYLAVPIGVRFEDPMAAEGAQPAALLVYGLPNSKPLALCITPFTSKADEYPVSGRSGDMNLLSWFQSGQGYVFMGWVEPEFLRKIGMELAYQRDTG